MSVKPLMEHLDDWRRALPVAYASVLTMEDLEGIENVVKRWLVEQSTEGFEATMQHHKEQFRLAGLLWPPRGAQVEKPSVDSPTTAANRSTRNEDRGAMMGMMCDPVWDRIGVPSTMDYVSAVWGGATVLQHLRRIQSED